MTLAARLAASVPERLLVRLISLAYRRFEPEIRRLDDVCGRGGTMIDIGGWYGPWTRRLRHRAGQVVVIEPTPLHQVLRRTLPPAVEVIAAAASDGCGEAELWVPHADAGARGRLFPAPAGHPRRVDQGAAGAGGRPRPEPGHVHQDRRGRP